MSARKATRGFGNVLGILRGSIIAAHPSFSCILLFLLFLLFIFILLLLNFRNAIAAREKD
jgi:hypothetical protein